MIRDSIIASYLALAVILLVTSIVGLLVVAWLDRSRRATPRVAFQHG